MAKAELDVRTLRRTSGMLKRRAWQYEDADGKASVEWAALFLLRCARGLEKRQGKGKVRRG